MSSIIQAVREYMAACPLLEKIPVKKRHVDWTDETADNYGIFPDSNECVKKFITGGGKFEYNFVLQVRLTTDEVKRLENAEFIEQMGNWCAQKTAEKNFPKMPENCTPTKISAANGMLFERDKTGRSGLYQIQFKLNYTKSGG